MPISLSGLHFIDSTKEILTYNKNGYPDIQFGENIGTNARPIPFKYESDESITSFKINQLDRLKNVISTTNLSTLLINSSNGVHTCSGVDLYGELFTSGIYQYVVNDKYYSEVFNIGELTCVIIENIVLGNLLDGKVATIDFDAYLTGIETSLDVEFTYSFSCPISKVTSTESLTNVSSAISDTFTIPDALIGDCVLYISTNLCSKVYKIPFTILQAPFEPIDLNPLVWIEDFTNVGGFFIDSSGNNRDLPVVTITDPDDGFTLIANDTDLIQAVTDAGVYSTYYIDDATPKQVKIADQLYSVDYRLVIDPAYQKNFLIFDNSIAGEDLYNLQKYIYSSNWSETIFYDADDFQSKTVGVPDPDWDYSQGVGSPNIAQLGAPFDNKPAGTKYMPRLGGSLPRIASTSLPCRVTIDFRRVTFGRVHICNSDGTSNPPEFYVLSMVGIRPSGYGTGILNTVDFDQTLNTTNTFVFDFHIYKVDSGQIKVDWYYDGGLYSGSFFNEIDNNWFMLGTSSFDGGLDLFNLEIYSGLPPIDTTQEEIDFYILWGDSNMIGRDTAANFGSYQYVQKYTKAWEGSSYRSISPFTGTPAPKNQAYVNLGPEVSFMAQIGAYKNKEVYCNKYGRGSSFMIDYLPGGVVYAPFYQQLKDSVKWLIAHGKTPILKGIIQSMGANDATNLTQANNFLTNLNSWHADFDTQWNTILSDNGIAAQSGYTRIIQNTRYDLDPLQIYGATVNGHINTFVGNPANNAVLIDNTTRTLLPDNVHYTSGEQINIGIEEFNILKDL